MDDVSSGEDIDWYGAAISAAFGAASGALAATGLGPVAQVALGAALAGAESAIDQGREHGFNNIDYGQVAVDAAIGGISSRANGLTKGDSKHLMQHGKNAAKRVITDIKNDGFKVVVSSIRSAGKYYFSQSNTMFYKPLLNSAGESVASSLLEAACNDVGRTNY